MLGRVGEGGGEGGRNIIVEGAKINNISPGNLALIFLMLCLLRYVTYFFENGIMRFGTVIIKLYFLFAKLVYMIFF
jgi:hypothetical protein